MSISASASPRSTAVRYSSHASSTLLFAGEYGTLVPGTYAPPCAQAAIAAIVRRKDNLFIARELAVAETKPARRTLQRQRKLAKRRAPPCVATRQKGTKVLFWVCDLCQI